MFFGGHCPPSERFDSPVGDGGLTKMWKPLLLKPGGVDDAEVARSRFLVGAVACTDLSFALPSAGDLPTGRNMLPHRFRRDNVAFG